MLAAMMGFCLVLTGAGPGDQSPEYHAGYEKGRKEADAELAAGGATMYAFGLLHDSLDRETGLLYKAIAGCVVDDQIRGRASGHNDRIAESIKEDGLPRNSFKRWEKELYNLEGTFQARAVGGRPRELTAGGPAVESPNGKFTIRLRELPEADRPRPEMRHALVVTEGGADRAEPQNEGWGDARKTEFVWGPEGSGLAFFRRSQFPPDQPEERVFSAFDLRSGHWVRQAIEFKPKPAAKAPAVAPESGGR